VERVAGQSSEEEMADNSEGSKAPVNTAETSPGVLTPKSNLKVLGNSPVPVQEEDEQQVHE